MTPLILFAHGAGAGHQHPWMQRWYLRLCDMGEVHRFTYPYMTQGKRLPDKLPKLIAAHEEMASQLSLSHPGRPIILIGKSMGARVSVHIADKVHASAVIALGYPLISSGRQQTVRDQPLRDVREQDTAIAVAGVHNSAQSLVTVDVMSLVDNLQVVVHAYRCWRGDQRSA